MHEIGLNASTDQFQLRDISNWNIELGDVSASENAVENIRSTKCIRVKLHSVTRLRITRISFMSFCWSTVLNQWRCGTWLPWKLRDYFGIFVIPDFRLNRFTIQWWVFWNSWEQLFLRVTWEPIIFVISKLKITTPLELSEQLCTFFAIGVHF